MNRPDLEGLSGSSAPVPAAESLSIREEAGAGFTVLRLAGSGLGENGKRCAPAPADDQADSVTTVAGVTVSVTQRGGWYVGPGRPGVMRGCDHCGRAYEARRSTSRFCSASCRACWSRDRREAQPQAQ